MRKDVVLDQIYKVFWGPNSKKPAGGGGAEPGKAGPSEKSYKMKASFHFV